MSKERAVAALGMELHAATRQGALRQLVKETNRLLCLAKEHDLAAKQCEENGDTVAAISHIEEATHYHTLAYRERMNYYAWFKSKPW